jgi:pSer/pThr/pTyr-binding forkhead associated (FHA) protein
MISEISVSREHCKISMSGDCYFLEDKDSKFGTLVSICQGILINPQDSLELQINQIFITANLVKTVSSRSWLCCGP